MSQKAPKSEIPISFLLNWNVNRTSFATLGTNNKVNIDLICLWFGWFRSGSLNPAQFFYETEILQDKSGSSQVSTAAETHVPYSQPPTISHPTYPEYPRNRKRIPNSNLQWDDPFHADKPSRGSATAPFKSLYTIYYPLLYITIVYLRLFLVPQYRHFPSIHSATLGYHTYRHLSLHITWGYEPQPFQH